MKAAIAACKGRICQRLDCADKLIVFDVRNARTVDRHNLDLSEWPVHGRAGRIVSLAVELLICGAISNFDEAGLDNSNVRLISGVTGPVDAVIAAVLTGAIAPGQSYWEGRLDARRQDA